MPSLTSEIHMLWGSTFFWKGWKLNVDFCNAVKNSEKTFSFLDHCIWICCVKFSLFTAREYLSSGVNRLTNCLKILDTTKKDIFEIKFSLRDGFLKCSKNLRKKSLVSYIVRFELVVVRSPYYRGNTCDQKSMC